ncbi:MAG TPA: hypothetical protein VFQ35_15820 [Polyangiaceae bacterium]|nr:hypothetical protein [Polyangiaceae bacterium]
MSSPHLALPLLLLAQPAPVTTPGSTPDLTTQPASAGVPEAAPPAVVPAPPPLPATAGAPTPTSAPAPTAAPPPPVSAAPAALIPPATAAPAAPQTPAPSSTPTPTDSLVPAPSASTAGLRRTSLAGFAEGALGLADDGFYNQLVGVRLDYRPSDRLALGFALSYANLKGKNGRAHNVLPAAMLEWRIPASDRVAIPVRFFSGYLPNNGPWLKAALGLSHRLGERSRITLEAIAPALWIVHDASVGSFDASLEYAVDL